jgi:hypothetical protein
MNDALARIRKEEVLAESRNLPGGTEENHKNPVTKADVPAEIQTENLPNKRSSEGPRETAHSE